MLSSLSFWACQPPKPAPEAVRGPSDHLVAATLWLQQATEAQLVKEQAYQRAERLLIENLKDYQRQAKAKNLRPPAVVLDIDETVLDNSPYQARLIAERETYQFDSWSKWVQEAQADLVPGAKPFLELADSLGLKIFYLSNRRIQNLGPTFQNLQSLGLPQADSASLLLRTNESDKTARRALVQSQHQIILLLGDQWGDFAEAHQEEWLDSARQYFVCLPNPTYGSFLNLPDTVVPFPYWLQQLDQKQ